MIFGIGGKRPDVTADRCPSCQVSGSLENRVAATVCTVCQTLVWATRYTQFLSGVAVDETVILPLGTELKPYLVVGRSGVGPLQVITCKHKGQVVQLNGAMPVVRLKDYLIFERYGVN